MGQKRTENGPKSAQNRTNGPKNSRFDRVMMENLEDSGPQRAPAKRESMHRRRLTAITARRKSIARKCGKTRYSQARGDVENILSF